ncbi:hypothetical protein E2C01_002577 [Portunus trituberculatus]|uniref:Uncharacterized protein n=1 Tax=Portunus trituberculatus TaxID=210409 RepID=A0A5B7CNL9_PORTR|nr:hypothetical protein [Portunus trituberculatus]
MNSETISSTRLPVIVRRCEDHNSSPHLLTDALHAASPHPLILPQRSLNASPSGHSSSVPYSK